MKKRVRTVAEESLAALKDAEKSVRWFKRTHEPLRAQITRTAQATRFWSVWREVFSDDADMLRRFEEDP